MIILRSERLVLYEILFPMDQILEKQVLWLNDPEVLRYSEQRHKKHSAATQLNYIFSKRPKSEVYLGIFLPSSKSELIGTISATIDANNSIADMGIMIGDKTQWNKGLASEAWKTLMDYLFDEKKIRKIEAGCMAKNTGMISVFKKCGMHKEGERKDHFMIDGGFSNMELWGAFK